MIEWQPIETAPVDRKILIYFAEEGVITEAKWDCSEFYPAWLPVHGCGCCSGDNSIPTHWAELNYPEQQ